MTGKLKREINSGRDHPPIQQSGPEPSPAMTRHGPRVALRFPFHHLIVLTSEKGHGQCFTCCSWRKGFIFILFANLFYSDGDRIKGEKANGRCNCEQSMGCFPSFLICLEDLLELSFGAGVAQEYRSSAVSCVLAVPLIVNARYRMIDERYEDIGRIFHR